MDCTPIFEKVLAASRKLNLLDNNTINQVLNAVADKAIASTALILAENAKDLARMDIGDPKYDRLKLTEQRIADIAADMRNVASLPSPLGRVLSENERPNGLKIQKISVPFGVIGIIYEARPNVTFDVFSLCLKSGNACVLKGGSDAIDSNTIITEIIRDVLKQFNIDEHVLTLLPAGREETAQLLNAQGYVDLIIPRGSQSLIDFVRKNASIPVIETGAGICHTYFDEYGDKNKAQAIVNNAKTRRVSVCNALDCLVIDEKRIADLPFIVELWANSNVVVYADDKAYKVLDGKYPAQLLEHANDESFGIEFLDYKASVKTVSSFNEAIEH
nr:glutamate-5-semialdehyde dehydrogenase [Prolixibacteraceae bacterium]